MKDLNYYFINRKLTRKKLSSFLQRYQSSGYTLNVGCGDQFYSAMFPNSVCVDIDERRRPDLVVDVHNMYQFSENTFDCVLCTEVLEHCLNPQKAADELFRVLKPGGILLLSTRFLYPLHDTPQDYYRFTKYGLLHLFSQFELIELQEEASAMETKGILYQRLAFQTQTKTPLARLRWFYLAELYSRRRRQLLQFGDLRHTGTPEIVFTSGYYLAAKKPNPDEEQQLS